MAIATDFSVTVGGDIRHDSGTETYTVLELHRWLQDLADDESASGNDLIDITSDTPSERSTDNIITLNAPFNIDDDASEYFYDGSITQDGGDTVYSGLVVVGALASTTTLKIVQNNLFYDDQASPFWGTGLNEVASANILLRIMVKSRDSGSDIDDKKIRVQARTYGDTYAEFSLTMGLGNATAAIFTNTDLNNALAQGTVDAWTIGNTEGYHDIDIDNNGTPEQYYSEWVRTASAGGAGNINDIYQYAKNITRSGTATNIHGINGELFRGITHQVAYDGQDVSEFFHEDEVLTWTGGTGLILADTEAGVDGGITGTLWIQLLTGTAPTDGLSLGDVTGCVADANGDATAVTISPCFLGNSTGSNLIGAFGIGIDTDDTSVGDQFFDLLDIAPSGPKLPPNNQFFTVGGLYDDGGTNYDRVLVGPKDTGDAFNFDQFTIDGAITGASNTITVETAGGGEGDETSIPADTPSTGTLRVLGDDGVYHRVPYTGISGLDFTGCSGCPVAADNNNMFLSYIDDVYDESGGASGNELKVSMVYNSDRNMYVRVRNGDDTPAEFPIKTFQTASPFGSGGGSVTAIRTSDE